MGFVFQMTIEGVIKVNKIKELSPIHTPAPLSIGEKNAYRHFGSK